MAKGNMLLGQARGKVGDLVFSRNNGQQVVRARTAVVKNPQTEAQIVQRIIMNTVAQAYSKMIAIVDHSFEGVSVGQQTMSAFMSANLNRLRRSVSAAQQANGSLNGIYSFTPLGAKDLAINPFVISQGSLSPIIPAAFGNDSHGEACVFLNIPGTPAELTYESFIEAFSLQRGDQITFVQLTYDAVQGIMFGYNRIILDPQDNQGIAAALSSPLFENGAIAYANERNNGSFARFTYEDGVFKYSVGGGTPVAAAIIVSRERQDGLWLRSNAALYCVADMALYGQYSLLDALNAFYSGGINFASDYYLNNADNLTASNTQASSSEPYMGSLSLGGTPLMASSAAAVIYRSAAQSIEGYAYNLSSDDTAIILFTPRTYNVGATAAAQSGDLTANVTTSGVSGTVTLAENVVYNTYLVVGGVVKRAYRGVTYTAETSAVTVAAPVISYGTPSEGSNTFTISGESGATIHYTTDGSTPTESSTVYSNTVTVSEETTVKAIAIKDGVSSSVATTTVPVTSGGGGGYDSGD